MFCPNFSDKKVKQLFDELKEAVGEIPAYDIWNLNQGLPIDRVPDGTDLGKPSKLFSDLVGHYNGDRQAAIKEKATAFSKSFKLSFGDWVNNKVSFKPGDIVFGHPGIGKTYSVEKGKFAGKFIDWDVEYNSIRDKWIEDHSNTKKGTEEFKKAKNEYLIYPENHPDYLEFLGKQWVRVKLKVKSENKILFVSPSTLLKLFPNDFNYIINLEDLDFIERGLNRGDKEPALWKQGINEVLLTVTNIPTLTLNKGEYLEQLLEKLEANSKLLDANGEPLASLLTSRYYGERVYLLLNDPNSFNRLNGKQELYYLELTQLEIIDAEQLLQLSENTIREFDYDSTEALLKILSDIRQSLLKGMLSRLKTIDMKDVEEATKLKAAIKYAIANLANENISSLDNILLIIWLLQLELHPVAHKVISAYKGERPKLSNEDLLSLNRNFFGFYCPTMLQVKNDLLSLDTYRSAIGKETYDNMKKAVADCAVLLDTCSNLVKKLLVANARLLMLDKGILAKSPTIYNYILSNTETTTNDISTLVKWLGAGDKINDEAVKSVYKIIQDAEDKTNHAVFERTLELFQLLKNTGNNQKVLFETDDNGKPTSYIVRASNYGKFTKDYKTELKQIRMDLGIDPNELGLPDNREIRIAYNKRKNEWLSKNSERKYTKEYYDLFNELSQESSDAREIVLQKIRNLTDKVKSADGFVEFERLSDEEWKQLNAYYVEKNQLSNIYDIYGNKKEGVELSIAMELTSLNEKLAKGLKMSTNEAKFNQAIANKQRLLEEGLISLKDYDKWIQRNTRTVYTEEFYELLKQIDRKSYGPKYDELNEKKRKILNMFRDTKSGEVDPNLMPPTTRSVLNKLDNELRAIRKKNKKASKDGGIQFEDVAKIVPTELYKRDETAVLALMEDNPGLVEAFYTQHTLQGPDGRRYPRSYYTKIVPKDNSYIKNEPSMNFTELSEDSPYFNRKFTTRNRALTQILKANNSDIKDKKIDEMLSTNLKEEEVYNNLSESDKNIVDTILQEGQGEYIQPKLETYGTYDKFLLLFSDPNLIKLRTVLINTIDESNKKMSNLSNMNKYKMPQISGSMYRFMSSNQGIIGGFFNYLKEGVISKGDDVGIRESTKYAPDGTSLNFIPLYFVLDLDDPSTVTADLVGGVLRYYLMAENFKNKGDIRLDVEAIKMFIKGRRYVGLDKSKSDGVRTFFGAKSESKEGGDTNLYKFIEKFIDMNLYDVKTNSITFTVKGKEVNISKLLSKFKALGTLRNLAWSLWISGTGFFTAVHNMLVLTLVGRYYDFNDSVNATKEMAYHVFAHGWRTAGNRNYKSKLMALMDYFEVGSSVDSMVKGTNLPMISRIFNGHWAYGFYSLVDFFVKGSVLNAVMFNYKNVKGEFLSKEDYLNKYGNTSTTQDLWKDYTSAYQSVEFVNGLIQVKKESDLEAWNKVKDIIGRTALNLGASADGTLNKLLKALFTANVFGSIAMMHRQYIPLAIQEKWTMDRQWDYTTQRYKEAIMRTPIRILLLIYRDDNNLSNIQKFIKAMLVITGIKTGITDQASLSNLRQLRIEIALIIGLYPIITGMLNAAADDDKKNKMINLLAYIMMRTLFESFSPYNLIDMGNTIKNPTALFSIIDNFGVVISYPMDLTRNIILDNIDINKKITRGAYKGMTPIQKNIIQLTPYKNVIELNDLPSKRNYYKKQILKE